VGFARERETNKGFQFFSQNDVVWLHRLNCERRRESERRHESERRRESESERP
jgi:hypothetical protein